MFIMHYFILENPSCVFTSNILQLAQNTKQRYSLFTLLFSLSYFFCPGLGCWDSIFQASSSSSLVFQSTEIFFSLAKLVINFIISSWVILPRGLLFWYCTDMSSPDTCGGVWSVTYYSHEIRKRKCRNANCIVLEGHND